MFGVDHAFLKRKTFIVNDTHWVNHAKIGLLHKL